MAVVHRRVREGVRSVWLSDHTRPFVIVLVEAAGQQITGSGRSDI
jgi:hypothetical protein